VDRSYELALRLALLLTAGITFIILAVAAADFFRRPVTGSGRRMRMHQAVAIVVGLAHVGTLAGSRNLVALRIMVAIALYLGGLGLFLWAQEAVKRRPPYLAFADTPPDSLADSGPYRYVRHPFYTANIVVWFAGVVATANLWLMATALWMTMRYAVAAAEEELAYEYTAFASQYRRYRARTGMFLPMPPAREGDKRRSLIGSSPLVIATVIAAVLLLCAVLVYDAFRAAAALATPP
jgi:protein-S-isoprenylcysteine O-methyltransferase Ste14